MSSILLVDDDPEVLELLQACLEPEHRVVGTSDWSQVSRLVFDEEYDLVLMDLNLPVITGDRLVEILQGNGQGGLNIALFSAVDEDDLRRRARELGVRYAQKTFDPEVLRRSIQRLLG